MNDHGVHADVLEECDVLGERVLQLVAFHGVSAVLDDQDLAGEAANVRQRLEERLGPLVDRIHQGFMPRSGRGYNPRTAHPLALAALGRSITAPAACPPRAPRDPWWRFTP